MAKRTTRRRRYPRFRRSRGHAKRKFSILTMAGFGAGLMVSLQSDRIGIIPSAIKAVKGEHSWEDFGNDLCQQTTGYDPRQNKWFLPTLPLLTVAGFAGHKVASYTGINRQFARLPSPLNKIEL